MSSKSRKNDQVLVAKVFTAATATEEYLLKLGITPMPRVLTDGGVRRISRRKLVK